jgi:hypothetical protein
MWLPWVFLFLNELTERRGPPANPLLLPRSLPSVLKLILGPYFSSICWIWAFYTYFLLTRASIYSYFCLYLSLLSIFITILMYYVLFDNSASFIFNLSYIYLSNSLFMSTFLYLEASLLRLSAASASLSFFSYCSKVLRSYSLSAWSVFFDTSAIRPMIFWIRSSLKAYSSALCFSYLSSIALYCC